MLSYIIRKLNVLKNAVIEINCHQKAVIKIAIGNRDNAYTDGHVFFYCTELLIFYGHHILL